MVLLNLFRFKTSFRIYSEIFF